MIRNDHVALNDNAHPHSELQLTAVMLCALMWATNSSLQRSKIAYAAGALAVLSFGIVLSSSISVAAFAQVAQVLFAVLCSVFAAYCTFNESTSPAKIVDSNMPLRGGSTYATRVGSDYR